LAKVGHGLDGSPTATPPYINPSHKQKNPPYTQPLISASFCGTSWYRRIGLEPILATDILDIGMITRGDGAVSNGDADAENKEEIGAVAYDEFFFF
jgi:hypothetical protein